MQFSIPVLEAYGGSKVVSWYDSIDRQLDSMISRYDAQHQHEIADRVRVFLNTWREHVLTGSVNRETIEPLKTAAEMLAADDWKLKNYFQNLRGQIRTLEASLEELPTSAFQSPTPDTASFPTAPPTNFGPQEKAPPGQSPEGAGAAPAPGAPGAPEAVPTGPKPEQPPAGGPPPP